MRLPFFRKLLLLALLGGCAGSMPVPGGTNAENGVCFSSIGEMKARLVDLKKGMTEQDVLQRLCPSPKRSLDRLERREIRIALLGGDNIPFSSSANGGEPDSDLIRDLYGYKITYRDVRRKHGFSSPIRIRTDETGFLYTITLIFRNSTLFEEPILTGGPINNARSGTIFDAITPGTLIDHALP